MKTFVCMIVFCLPFVGYSQDDIVKSFKIIHESVQAASDAQILVEFKDVITPISSINYEYKGLGNFQKTNNYKLTDGNKLIISALPPGNFFNLSLTLKDATRINLNSKFQIDYGAEFRQTDASRIVCGNLTFTDCNGNTITRTGLETGKAYNIDGSASTPCGFEVSSSCTIENLGKWQCVVGNQSAPAAYTDHTITNYAGLGLSALTAARIAWVICNYPNPPVNESDPAALAVWYLTGTGGSQNSVYNQAVANVTAPNGTENSLVFYQRKYSTNQDYVKWECNISCMATPPSLCASNISKVYNFSEVGLTCEPVQRNLQFVLYYNNLTYQIKPGTVARLVEYTDGTVKGTMQLVKNDGTLGNIDLNVGFNVEITGSQKTTGSPASPWTPAVG